MPQPLARALGNISATYTKHDNNSNRLRQSLVDSEAMRVANCTIRDIVFLAQEFNRRDFNHAHVRGFVKLHRQRTMSNSAIAMHQRVEEATVRMMMPEKVAQLTEMAMIEAVAKYARNDGPFTVSMILGRFFCTWQRRVEFTHEAWSALMKQSLEGQLMAVHIYMCGYHKYQRRTRMIRVTNCYWHQVCGRK